MMRRDNLLQVSNVYCTEYPVFQLLFFCLSEHLKGRSQFFIFLHGAFGR